MSITLTNIILILLMVVNFMSHFPALRAYELYTVRQMTKVHIVKIIFAFLFIILVTRSIE